MQLTSIHVILNGSPIQFEGNVSVDALSLVVGFHRVFRLPPAANVDRVGQGNIVR